MNLVDEIIDLNNIAEVVSSAMDTNISLNSRKRKNINGVRVYCYIARSLTGASFKKIGQVINRSHAQVLVHNKDFESLTRYDQNLNNATKYCMRLCRDMLGKKSLNWRDQIQLYWPFLSLQQQKKIGMAVIRYANINKKGK